MLSPKKAFYILIDWVNAKIMYANYSHSYRASVSHQKPR